MYLSNFVFKLFRFLPSKILQGNIFKKSLTTITYTFITITFPHIHELRTTLDTCSDTALVRVISDLPCFDTVLGGMWHFC